MVSEVEVELERHCCCRLRMLARNVTWRERSEIVRRWSVIGLDIACCGLKSASSRSDEEDSISRVDPGRSRERSF